MAETTKPSIKQFFGLFSQLVEGIVDRFNRFAESNMEMALYHFTRGNYNDAALRYRLVLWKQPKNVEAWVGLGISLVMTGDIPRGRDALRKALKLQPGHEKAEAAMQMLSRLPQTAPPSQKP
jgi:Flp pilus assembly protein TadD